MKTLIFVLLLVGLTFGNNLNLDLNQKCKGIEDFKVVRDLDRGCDAYIYCVQGLGSPGRCQNGYFFNEGSQKCDESKNVACGVGNWEATTTDRWVTTTDRWVTTTDSDIWKTTTTAEPSFCGPNQLYTSPHSSKCSKYLMCMDGVENEWSCSPGFHYSTKLSQCIQQDQANCTLENPVCPEIDEPNHPTFFAHPDDCNRFYICHRGDLIPSKCTAENHWNQEYRWCVAPKDSKCK